jgi:hypothetical protein
MADGSPKPKRPNRMAPLNPAQKHDLLAMMGSSGSQLPGVEVKSQNKEDSKVQSTKEETG